MIYNNNNKYLCQYNNLQLEKTISTICKNEYKWFLNKQNIEGLGCGYKVKNGFRTCNLCIQIFVKKKLSKCLISDSNLVPNFYKNIPTDVIEIGETFTCSLKNKVRPVLGGYGISANNDYEYGTTGCLVTNGVRNFILSTNHVLAGENQFALETPIIQPAKKYGGFHPNDSIASLYRYIPIRFIEGTHEPINLTDRAIGLLNSPNIFSPKIALIDSLKGIKKSVKLNDNIKKVGCSSELTLGTINSLHVTSRVTFNSGRRCLFNDLIFTSPMCQFGDCGAVTINNYNYAIGMIFSLNETFSVCCYLSTALDQLGVHLVTY